MGLVHERNLNIDLNAKFVLRNSTKHVFKSAWAQFNEEISNK